MRKSTYKRISLGALPLFLAYITLFVFGFVSEIQTRLGLRASLALFYAGVAPLFFVLFAAVATRLAKGLRLHVPGNERYWNRVRLFVVED